ncbi:MAG: shikimate dehydrogenase [Flavobacteriales bacterium]|nr:shikimate dehydrogenase [Flavobacteriales bacterium]
MKTLGLIGKGLSHTFSPSYFEQKFERESIRGFEYKVFELDSAGDVQNLFKTQSIVGLNVTIPFKRDILEFCDIISEEVTAIGAANTLKISRQKHNIEVTAHNTDYIGFLNSLPQFENKPKALVLGSGGSSKAVQFALKKINVEYLIVSSSDNGDLKYDQLGRDLINEHNLIVNTTPLGMYPNINAKPDIPFEYLDEKHVLYDLIYNPSETEFLTKGKHMGCTCFNGLEMLKLQAEESWRIWTEVSNEELLQG